VTGGKNCSHFQQQMSLTVTEPSGILTQHCSWHTHTCTIQGVGGYPLSREKPSVFRQMLHFSGRRHEFTSVCACTSDLNVPLVWVSLVWITCNWYTYHCKCSLSLSEYFCMVKTWLLDFICLFSALLYIFSCPKGRKQQSQGQSELTDKRQTTGWPKK